MFCTALDHFKPTFKNRWTCPTAIMHNVTLVVINLMMGLTGSPNLEVNNIYSCLIKQQYLFMDNFRSLRLFLELEWVLMKRDHGTAPRDGNNRQRFPDAVEYNKDIIAPSSAHKAKSQRRRGHWKRSSCNVSLKFTKWGPRNCLPYNHSHTTTKENTVLGQAYSIPTRLKQR